MNHRRRHQGNPFVVYTDAMTMLFCWANMIIAMLLISAHLVVQQTPQHKTDTPGEFLVTLTWDDSRDLDLDLWMQDPFGDVIFYGNREAKNISLDRDSRGFITNEVQLPDGRKVYSGNREVITIRTIIPGNYLVAVGYYSSNETHTPVDAIIKITKLNPAYEEVFGSKIHLDNVKDSKNVVAFHVDENGNVSILPTPINSLIDSLGGGHEEQQ